MHQGPLITVASACHLMLGWVLCRKVYPDRTIGADNVQSPHAQGRLMDSFTFHTTFRRNQIDPSVFIAPGAIIVGDVTLSAECSVWFHASLRGDAEAILVGPRTNIQEGVIFHADPGYPAVVGTGVTIGHGAIVHGARIGNNCVIGMRATL